MLCRQKWIKPWVYTIVFCIILVKFIIKIQTKHNFCICLRSFTIHIIFKEKIFTWMYVIILIFFCINWYMFDFVSKHLPIKYKRWCMIGVRIHQLPTRSSALISCRTFDLYTGITRYIAVSIWKMKITSQDTIIVFLQ